MSMRYATFATISALSGALMFSISCQAADFRDSFFERLASVLRDHHLAKMVDADLESAEAQVGVERSAYLPQLKVDGSVGWQDISRETGADGTFDPREANVGLNQLVYDFGATSSRVRVAKIVAEKERYENTLQRQNLILAAVEAHLQLLKARQVKGFADQSESNVRTQTLQENARVEAGKGYATDVLQAKAQLAGAEARRVASESALRLAENRFASVFGVQPQEQGALEGIRIPGMLLPASLEETEEAVKTNNPDVLAAQARALVAEATLRSVSKREYMPKLDMDVSRAAYNDRDGSEGKRYDTLVKLNFKWSFDTGLKAKHQVDSVGAQAMSEHEKANYTRVQALEEARNAWHSWMAAKERTSFLLNQVEISNQFLSLARRERDYGRRSLLDILNAEVALINAQSDAAEAQIDEVLAAVKLLRASGKLNVDLFAMDGVVLSPKEGS